MERDRKVGMRYILFESTWVHQHYVSDGRKVKKMKKLWRRVLLLSALFVLAMSVHALADNVQYSAKTITFPNSYGGGWSNQFTVYSNTNIAVGINILQTSMPLNEYSINSNITYLLENVYTHQKYYLTDKSYYSRNYEVHMTVPAGTYSFGVYYSGSYAFNLYFRVTGSSGINVPDELEVLLGDSETVSVTRQNAYGTYSVYVNSAKSSNKSVAQVTNINNSTTPSTITVTGVGLGDATVTIVAADGSTDTMIVHVVSSKTAPTLLDKVLNMGVGDVVNNEVINETQSVTWSSSNKKVATVTNLGNGMAQIKAVGVGTATIHAKTQKAGTSYDLACKVTVGQTDPDFIIRMTNIYPLKKRVKISITNSSGAPMVVYSSGAQLLEWPGYGYLRTLKMKSGKKVTINNNKTKKITFNIKGTKLDMTGKTIADFGVRVKFKIGGRTYFARCCADKHLGQYILRENLATGNWQFSSSLYEV